MGEEEAEWAEVRLKEESLEEDRLRVREGCSDALGSGALGCELGSEPGCELGGNSVAMLVDCTGEGGLERPLGERERGFLY